MKTTLDLPDDLVQKLKIRAVQERKPLKRFVADLLVKGLETVSAPTLAGPNSLPEGIVLNERGFPVIRCGPKASSPLTIEQALALEQQALHEEDLHRAGLLG